MYEEFLLNKIIIVDKKLPYALMLPFQKWKELNDGGKLPNYMKWMSFCRGSNGLSRREGILGFS